MYDNEFFTSVAYQTLLSCHFKKKEFKNDAVMNSVQTQDAIQTDNSKKFFETSVSVLY